MKRWIIPDHERASPSKVAAALQMIEERMGGPLPDDDRHFLARYNGGNVLPCHFVHNDPVEQAEWGTEHAALSYLFGVGELLERVGFKAELASWPMGTLPIGGVSGGG